MRRIWGDWVVEDMVKGRGWRWEALAGWREEVGDVLGRRRSFVTVLINLSDFWESLNAVFMYESEQSCG